LRPYVPTLLERIVELAPERIILIKADVYDTAYLALAAAGLPVSAVRVPFPSSGQQGKFRVAFGRALAGE
jgi:ABC-type histidine transport system ATPase subunit